MPNSEQGAPRWEIRPGGFVGSRAERRDFEVMKRGTATRFTVALPWNDRQPEREQEEQCAELILRLLREIAKQETLPVRR
jgi:hypothetical protein